MVVSGSLLFATTLLALAGVALAGTADVQIDVFFSVRPPFVMVQKGPFIAEENELLGYDVELWKFVEERVRQENPGVRFVHHLVAVSTFEATTLRTNTSVALAAIPISSALVSGRHFSPTYFKTGLDVLVSRPKTEIDLLLVLKPFTWQLWAVIAVSVFISGIFVWFLEHSAQPRGFPHNIFLGVNEGIWYCWSCLTTTLEKDLVSFPARMFSVGWTWVSVFIIAAYTAQLTAMIAYKQFGVTVGTFRDLQGRAVGVVIDSSAERFVREQLPSSMIFAFEHYSQAVEAVLARTTDAIVGDASVLEWLRLNDARLENFPLLGNLLSTDFFGVLMSEQLPEGVRQSVDNGILAALDSGLVLQLNRKYFNTVVIQDENNAVGDVAPLGFTQLAGTYVLVAISLGMAIVSYLLLCLCRCY
eukprot:Amastigsp_a4574_54.p1 type:complete len:416 gc:universal Amastigsp_a4574_54:56-1303(+)